MERRNMSDSIRYKTIDGVKHKICMECEKYFPMTNEYFYKNKSNKKDGLNTYCITCVFERAKKWVETHPKEYKEQKLRKVAVKTDIQRQRSRDAANRNRKEGYQKKWRQEHPDKIKIYNLNKTMNKKHSISKIEWESCKIYFNSECAYCGISEEKAKQEQGQYFHKEHVDHSGVNDLSNCVPSCRSCNSRKWKYEFKEWYNKHNKTYTIERYNKIMKWMETDYKLYIEEIPIQ